MARWETTRRSPIEIWSVCSSNSQELSHGSNTEQTRKCTASSSRRLYNPFWSPLAPISTRERRLGSPTNNAPSGGSFFLRSSRWEKLRHPLNTNRLSAGFVDLHHRA